MTLERGSSHDESVKGGNQPADMSLIHRRCTVRAALSTVTDLDVNVSVGGHAS